MIKRSATPTPALHVQSLTVRRSRTFTLNIPRLELPSGRVICVAGANGSGKTTFIETVVGLLTPNTGTREIAGQPLAATTMAPKRALGFVPDDDGWIIPELTAQEYLLLLASIYRQPGATTNPLATAKTLAHKLLFDSFDQQLSSLSHGNRKKVQLIAALMHSPALLVVDELRNGLDPIAINHAENLLKERAASGTAVLAATHDLWWAQRFADEILMLHQGNVILHQETAKIVAEAGSVEAKFLQLYSAQTSSKEASDE